ncbi:unnamed protein product [Fraxinus pennsylvanica]|uniref:Small nuclear ribonucleoprotein G n=1 Tax=Fraxinus pennsylvanica TaxID=56036 RepID=A0AAD2A8T9_9LAMI|nr:unnamed protein product [Fraxinus pennsylvanica]
MSKNSSEILQDLSPLLRVYKNGRVERLIGTDCVPPSVDPATGVQSKDVKIAPELNHTASLKPPPAKVLIMSRSGQPPDLKKYMDKKLQIKLNANRMVVGTLRGFDQFMNLVVDNTVEVNGNEKNEIGMVVIRGNSVVTVEALEPLYDTRGTSKIYLKYAVVRIIHFNIPYLAAPCGL